MTFISLGIERSCLTQQKDLLEYEEMVYSDEKNQITESMADYLDDDTHSTDDNTYAQLEAYQEQYDTKTKSIETQLQAINAELEGYEKAVSNNIKSDCKLSLSV